MRDTINKFKGIIGSKKYRNKKELNLSISSRNGNNVVHSPLNDLITIHYTGDVFGLLRNIIKEIDLQNFDHITLIPQDNCSHTLCPYIFDIKQYLRIYFLGNNTLNIYCDSFEVSRGSINNFPKGPDYVDVFLGGKSKRIEILVPLYSNIDNLKINKIVPGHLNDLLLEF